MGNLYLAIGPKPVVLHGHIYQPPRDIVRTRKPHSLEVREMPEESASPYLNWTRRIIGQCYEPIKDAYRNMSWNISPTLSYHLDPSFLEDLKRADRLNLGNQDGHGAAIATTFHHIIMPLANTMDKYVQIQWGIEYFREIFGRPPEGFWLPECAVDLPTLSALSSFGIKFAVISPHSAKNIWWNGSWHKIKYDKDDLPLIEHGIPYQVNTNDGREINVFAYDQYLCSQLGFSDILERSNSAELARKIDQRFDYHPSVNLAVDMETYGHHKKNGVKVLFDYLDNTSKRYGHQLTNYGRLLSEARKGGFFGKMEIYSPSSWGCSHGVERWQSNCGCYGDNPWRQGLREAFTFLADRTDMIYMKETERRLNDPNGAKLRYIDVLLRHRSFEDFLSEQQHKDVYIGREGRERLSMVFDAILPRQAIFTSCGWYFEGMGIETGINLGFAYDLSKRMERLAPTLENEFRDRLNSIRNGPGWERRMQPASALAAYDLTRKGQMYWAEKGI